MNRIEIICSMIGAIAIVLTGVWFIVKKAFSSGIEKNKFDTLGVKVSNLPCDDHKIEMTETSQSIKFMLKELQEIKNGFSRLPCDDHKESIKDSRKRHEDVSSILNSNNEILVGISKWIMKTDPSMIGEIMKKTSPYKLTPVGEIIFDKSGAKNAVEENSEFLISALEKINPQTAYDVEDSALTVLLQNTGHKLFQGIKKFLYNSPEVIEVKDPTNNDIVCVKLSLQGILKMMSIRIRDMYLEKYPEINSDNV